MLTRGLLSELEITLGEWHALALCPVAEVRVMDVSGLSFVIKPVAGGWRLTGPIRAPERNVGLGGHNLPSAVGPWPVLTDGAREWAADQFFGARGALVEGIARESASIVDDLKDAAGDRWPRPRT